LSDFVAQSHSPHDRCVRFSPAVAGRACNTRYRAARYALPGRDFHPLDRASFAWRTRCSSDPDNRNIGDFRRWKDHDAYQKALERVLRDLKVAQAGP
jgi:hypothetical protein